VGVLEEEEDFDMSKGRKEGETRRSWRERESTESASAFEGRQRYSACYRMYMVLLK